jgi:hypothetical protein
MTSVFVRQPIRLLFSLFERKNSRSGKQALMLEFFFAFVRYSAMDALKFVSIERDVDVTLR